jgi:K+-transporting ATPase A subunit
MKPSAAAVTFINCGAPRNLGDVIQLWPLQTGQLLLNAGPISVWYDIKLINRGGKENSLSGATPQYR